jgi:hypothetical protein
MGFRFPASGTGLIRHIMIAPLHVLEVRGLHPRINGAMLQEHLQLPSGGTTGFEAGKWVERGLPEPRLQQKSSNEEDRAAEGMLSRESQEKDRCTENDSAVRSEGQIANHVPSSVLGFRTT